jgi:hypothetical protein
MCLLGITHPKHILLSQGISHRGGPGSKPGLGVWDLWWTKWRYGRFSPNTSVSPAYFYYTNFSPQSPSPIIRVCYCKPVLAAVPKVPAHILKKHLNALFFSFKISQPIAKTSFIFLSAGDYP